MPEPNETQRQKAREIVGPYMSVQPGTCGAGIVDAIANALAEGVSERDSLVNAVLRRVGKRWRSTEIDNLPLDDKGRLEFNGTDAAIVADVEGASLATVEFALNVLTAAAELRGQAQGLEMATIKSQAIADALAQDELAEDFEDAAIILGSQHTVALSIVEELRALSPDPNYATTTIAAATLERAARIVEQPFQGVAHSEQERWRVQLVNQLAREIRSLSTQLKEEAANG